MLFRSKDIDVTTLEEGLHTFNIRFQDNTERWSSLSSKLFVKLPIINATDNKLTAYEYWFDSQDSQKVVQNIEEQSSILLSKDIDVTTLEEGLHTFNIRFQDNTERWSSLSSKFFVKLPVINATANKLTTYEYWIDNNYTEKKVVSVNDVSGINIIEDLDISEISEGLHLFNIRFLDSKGASSSVISQLFHKIPSTLSEEKKLAKYELWFDNLYEHRTTYTIDEGTSIALIDDVDISAMRNGLHRIHFRFQDNSNDWSTVISGFFEKIGGVIGDKNEIVQYRYWFDEAIDSRQRKLLDEKEKLFELDSDIATSGLNQGQHIFNIQFQDSLGLWSSVVSAPFQQQSVSEDTVIADFSFHILGCGMIEFINKSQGQNISFNWEFGDGHSSQETNPIHQYNTSGSYTSHLLVTQVSTNKVSTIIKEITIPAFEAEILELQANICQGDSYLFGTSVYTTSGIYRDTFLNNAGCDSITILELTVNPDLQISQTLHLCEGEAYQIGDSSYTKSGNYQNIFLTPDNCDSIINTTLIIHSTYEDRLTIFACDTMDTEPFTMVYTTQFGCDSILHTDYFIQVPTELDLGGDLYICQGDTIVIDGGDYPGSYSWSNGATSSSISVSDAGMYVLTVSSLFSCDEKGSVRVHFYEQSEIITTPSGLDTLCEGDEITLSIQGTTSYQWNTGSNSLSTIATINGDFTVTITDEYGCSYTKSKLIIFNPLPDAYILQTATNPLALTAYGGEEYLWNTGERSATITPMSDGFYSITATNEYGCISEAGFQLETQGDDTLPVVDTCTSDVPLVYLSAKMMLQGCYNKNHRLMDDNLRAKGYIPLIEPYSDIKYRGDRNYYPSCGGRSITDSLGVLGVNGSNAVIDWVFVELWTAVDTQIIAARAALLQRDGDIVEPNGISPLAFPVGTGDYFVIIRHRNHLSAMTRMPIFFEEEGVTEVDFRNPDLPTYGNYALNNISGMMTLWSGNANNDGRIVMSGVNNDRDPIFFDVFFDQLNSDNIIPSYNYVVQGYYVSDLNMDGKVKYQGPKNDIDGTIFFNILFHPMNIQYRLNFIIQEQVPL